MRYEFLQALPPQKACQWRQRKGTSGPADNSFTALGPQERHVVLDSRLAEIETAAALLRRYATELMARKRSSWPRLWLLPDQQLLLLMASAASADHRRATWRAAAHHMRCMHCKKCSLNCWPAATGLQLLAVQPKKTKRKKKRKRTHRLLEEQHVADFPLCQVPWPAEPWMDFADMIRMQSPFFLAHSQP